MRRLFRSSGSNKILGAYFTDTVSPANKLLHFTVAARYNSNTETLDGYSVDTDVGDVGDGFDEASRWPEITPSAASIRPWASP